jgi:hypothetical protein
VYFGKNWPTGTDRYLLPAIAMAGRAGFFLPSGDCQKGSIYFEALYPSGHSAPVSLSSFPPWTAKTSTEISSANFPAAEWLALRPLFFARPSARTAASGHFLRLDWSCEVQTFLPRMVHAGGRNALSNKLGHGSPFRGPLSHAGHYLVGSLATQGII